MDISKLCFHYPRETDIIHNLSLSLRPGDCIAITGNNGAGKSSLCQLISGLLIPQSGTIDISQPTLPHLEPSTFVLQQKLYPNCSFPISVEEFILLSRSSPHGDSIPIDPTILSDLIDEFGLSEYRNCLLYTLSGGQQQRAAILQLYCAPSMVLILDEPTQGLDIKYLSVFIELVKRAKKEQRIVIIITHALYLLHEVIDTAFVLNKHLIEQPDTNWKCPFFSINMET